MRKTPFLIVVVCALFLGVVSWAQGVRAVVVNEFANIRTVPAIGAEVIATVSAGYTFEIVTGRSGDSQWLRIEFNGDEGWVNLAPLSVLSGDINALEVADPRSIPYGGWATPRAGQSTAQTMNIARAVTGLRVRSGPGQGYPTIANIFTNELVMVFGRTPASTWVQVSYEGTLGWASSGFLAFQNGLTIGDLPIDGIIAESPPLAERTSNDYFDTLKLLLARLDLAQPSLDNIRGKWTDAALTGRAGCRDYPDRPSDYNIPVPLLASFFNTLDPLQRDFNDAMANLRLAIDLFIEVCNQPGTGNPVGQATVIGALDVVNLVDSQFASLRERLLALIPPDREPGPNECLFVYRDRAEILPVITIGQVVRQPITFDKRAFGYCFDALGQQNLAFLMIKIRGELEPLTALSPFDNPTNFLAVGRISIDSDSLVLAPIVIPEGGRHLVLMADLALDFDEGEVAFVILNYPASGILPSLIYDEATDTVGLSTGIGVFATSVFATTDPNVTPNNNMTFGTQAAPTCPSLAFTCDQLFTCQEAYACLAQGNTSLDPDGNGVPCPNLCAP